jgi:pimeloyl-ACP methyl ester carboxylesterase/nucleotide-binding universal stress UspA family protein
MQKRSGRFFRRGSVPLGVGMSSRRAQVDQVRKAADSAYAETTRIQTPASTFHASPELEEHGKARAPLAYHRRAGGGLSLIQPLSYGVTIDGIAAAFGQEAFLDAAGSGFDLITYDQRGAGQSAGAGEPSDWAELGADLWRVADAAGVERAVLYGVADAGYTVAHAAVQRPDRVLGVIFNFVPPKFVADEPGAVGVPSELIARWFEPLADGSSGNPRPMLEDLGIDEGDARALAEHWQASSSPDAAERRRDLMSRADISELLPTIAGRALVMQPKRRELFHGWGDAMAALLPNARTVYPSRGIEAIGAMHAFLAVLTSDIGRQASRLSPELSATVESSEQSFGELQRIAVAIDDDVVSGRAVELACRLGEGQRAEIILIHVIEVPYARPLDQPADDAKERGERALELGKAIVERHRLASCRSRLVMGRSVASSIVRTAEEESADLIVVSTSEDGLHGMSSSPVVAEVLRRAPGRVLVNSGTAA